jgi:hypothetical protein
MTREAVLIDHEVDPDKAVGTFEVLALPSVGQRISVPQGRGIVIYKVDSVFHDPVELPGDAMFHDRKPRVRLYAREIDLEA